MYCARNTMIKPYKSALIMSFLFFIDSFKMFRNSSAQLFNIVQ